MIIEASMGLAALLVFVLARQNFWQAIMLISALMPAYIIRFRLGGIPTNTLELLIAAIALAALLAPSVWQIWSRRWLELPAAVKISAGLFLGAAIVSTFISPQLRTSLGIFKSWVLVPMVFAFLIYAAKPTDKQKRQLLGALVWSASVVSVIALVIGFTNSRLQAFYDTPNSLALYVAPILTVTIWRLLIQGKQKQGWVMVAATVQTIALLGSQSVAGALSLLASLLIGSLLWLQGERRRKVIIFLGMVLLLALAVFGASGKVAYFLEPLENPSTHTSATVRLQLWSISVDLLKENPVLGLGLGQFEPAYQQKLHQRFLNPTMYTPQPISEFVFRDPHNVLLSLWLNTGLFGLLSFIALHATVLKKSWQTDSPINQPVILGITTLLIFGITDTIFWKNDLSVLHFMLIAVALI